MSDDSRVPEADLPTGPEPVKPEPFWSQLPQLFVVPLVIVLVCVGIYATFGVLGGESLDTIGLLREIETTTDARRRDQCAYELALALSKQQTAPPGLVPEIARIMEQDKLPPETRAYLALALGRLGPDARPALAAALLSEHAEVKAHAALSLGLVGTKAEVPALVELTKRDKPLLRKVGLLAVSRIALREAEIAPQAVSIGKLQLQDSDLQVSWNAALILSQLDDTTGVPVLRRMADRAYVHEHLERAYREAVGEDAEVIPLEASLGTGMDEMTRAAEVRLLVDTCRALGRIGGPADAQLLANLAGSEPTDQRSLGALEVSVLGLVVVTFVLLLVGFLVRKSQLKLAAVALGLVALCLAPLGDFSAPNDPVAMAADRARAEIQARHAKGETP